MRRSVVLAFLTIGAIAVPAATASAAGKYGSLIGRDTASGSSSATDIGWGAHLTRAVTSPRSFTVIVHSTLRPGYFCQIDCHETNVQWDVACSRPGLAKSRQGGMFGVAPLVGHPKLSMSGARRCTIRVNAQPNSYVGGSIDLRLYHRR